MRRRVVLVAVAAVVLAVLGTVLVTSGGDERGPDPVAFCDQLDRLTRNDPFAAFGDRATTAEVLAAFTALEARAEELRVLAPDAARAVATDLAEATTAMADLLRATGGDPAAVDTRAYREEQRRYAEAADRLERYLTSSC